MSGKKLPQVGDVIRSARFAFGYREHEESSVILVGTREKKHPVMSYLGEEERVRVAARTGKVPPKTRTFDRGAYDAGRAKARFVVETGVMQGGGTGQGTDIYPDGWYVTARRLRRDGTYDPKGEVIGFYMSDGIIDMIPPEEVKIVGKLKRSFR